MFAVMCILLFFSTYIQGLCFGIGAENLIAKVRFKLLEAIIYKHIGWFDDKDKAPGILGSII
jgi:hypothetical protein